MRALQEEEKAVAAADSKVASRFAYDVLVNEGEAAGAKGAGVKRGKDGHVQLASGDDFFSAPPQQQRPEGVWQVGNALIHLLSRGALLVAASFP